MTLNEFYETQVFEVDVDFSELPEGQVQPLRTDRVQVASIVGCVAAIAVAGVLTLTVASASMSTPVAWHEAASTAPAAAVERVPVPDGHRAAADRFKKLFGAVPLNDVERLPDPDYDL
jgi:hypothetical protein